MNKKWFRLDNAALIFPAISLTHWTNVFRVSATLEEDIDPIILKQAVNELKHRFPTFFVKLRRGVFWYYLQENTQPIEPILDYAYPLTLMPKSVLRKSCIRVLYYHNRIAIEIFHAVTDGNGGMLFLKNLVAHYYELKKNTIVSKTEGVWDLNEEPNDEIKDAFPLVTGRMPNTLKAETPYKLKGTLEPHHYRHLILGIVDSQILKETAHRYGVTVTSFLSAVMLEAIIKMERSRVKENHLKPVNVSIPTNLRKLFGINTIRNFILAVNVGVNPRDGEYSLKELCEQVQYQVRIYNTPQKMQAEIAGHVLPAQNKLMKIVPLGLKDIILRIIYYLNGETKGCLTVSNLGVIEVPNEIKDYIQRMEFIIGTQLYYPNNCSIVSYNNKTYINMIRSIKESELEELFFSRLVELGIPVEIESN